MKVMISYSSQDWEVVEQFAKALEEDAITVWLDKWMIHYGSDIIQDIEKSIEDAEFLLLMLSANSTESGWVQKEWRSKFADELQQKETKVICVRLDECKIPSILATKKYIDMHGDPKVTAHELSKDIKLQYNKRLNAPFINILRDLSRRVMQQKETPFTDVKQEFQALNINENEPKLAFEILFLLVQNKELLYELLIFRIDDNPDSNEDDPTRQIMNLSYQARRVELKSKLDKVKEVANAMRVMSKSLADSPQQVFDMSWRTIVRHSSEENKDVESNRLLKKQEQ